MHNGALETKAALYDLIWKDSADEMVLAQLVFDDKGSPVDCIILDGNSAFEKHSGLTSDRAFGRKASEMHPVVSSMWLEKCAEVVRSGKTLEMVEHDPLSDRWYNVRVSSFNSQNMFIAIHRDITIRRQAKAALEEREKQLRTVLDNSRDGITMLDLATERYAFISPALFEMTGFSPEEANGVSRAVVASRVHPDDRQLFVNLHDLFASPGTSIDAEFRWRVKSGEYRWFSHRRKLVQDEHGHPVAMVGITRDITESKKIEQAMRDNEQRLEALVEQRTAKLDESNRDLVQTLESITDAFFTIDREWRVTYWNRAAEEISGVKREDILGNGFWEAFPAALGSDSCRQFHAAMSESKPVSFVAQTIYGGGWVEMRVFPSPSGITVYERDITASKLAVEKLRESNDRFYKAFNSSPIAMVILSQMNRVIDINQYGERLIGYSREEVMGKTMHELIGLGELVDFPMVFQELAAKGMVGETELQIRRKSGELRDIYASAVLMQLDGEPCLLGVARDVTEEKRYGVEMTRLDRLDLVGQMAASIGHEIRNPMTVVRGFLQIMSQKQQYHDDRERLLLMIDELDRANGIISNFLSMAGNKAVSLIPRDLNEVIHCLLPLIQADATLNGITVQMVSAPLPPVLLDQNELRQLLLNLTRNGIEAMQSGGVLTIRTTAEQGEVLLEVTDHGPGIPAEILENIGRPFRSTKENGTGLGLAVCYSIANRLNAKIEVDTGSTGTTFRIRFIAMS